jgi:Alpha/beta hydrolase family
VADFTPPVDADPALISTQRQLLLNQVTEHRAKVAALSRQQAQKEAEQATTLATIHKLETMIPVIQPRVDIRKTLMEKELGSKLTYYETLQLLVEQQEELSVQKSHLHEAEAAVAAVRETRGQAVAEFRRTLSDELAKAVQKANGLTQDLIKAEQKTRLQLLTAPVDGVVQQLANGGLLAMMLAVLRPTAIGGVILNDIGPVIEPQGLLRIKGHVGKLPIPRNFEEGAEILRWLFDAEFPKLAPQDWIAFAQRTWREHGGGLVPDYDLKLARTLQGANLEHLPTLWNQFDALARVPLMVIRGANSDMLASTTLDAMLARRRELEVAVVPDQGHAPLPAEPKLIRQIAAFVASCDVSARR